ncbi:class I SAM-dependent methyltransferase [Paraliomyxa miuraensis]|uniref:class I SAM-dependent methyltransferase n=1 Tax=Paraliomyxa miuraensis TaxID=376150 RepID=UPI002257C6C6|nr:class I SAM-dependent methyltransferase [Paraliomyxa miuraensis]MCX4239957.1 class I SAM-dependent methyltransferase [Paraliomyxa miuraensis]
MSEHAERIGPTAHYTAYVWRRAGLPHAEHFATRTGAVLYWGFFVLGEWATRLSSTVPTMHEFLEYRHRLIDAVVAELRPGCVVELGAGLTRRAVTWAADHGVPGLELDLPAMAAIKRRALARAPAALRERLRGRHAVHDADALAPEFAARLASLLREHQRPVVILEGVVGYFDAGPRARMFAAVAQALREAGGGHMVCDLHTVAAQARVGWATHVLKAATRSLTRRRKAQDPFADLDAVARTLDVAGFDAWHEEHPEHHQRAQPRLARLRSPAHVIVARVDGPALVERPDGLS